MNNIKLVAVDMDGTLLNSHKEVPADFEDWVLDHPDIKVVAASGRQYYTLRDMFPKAKDRLLYSAENGGLVFEQGKNIYRNAMSREDVAACLQLADQLTGVTPILCAVDSAYMRHASKETEDQGHMYYHHLTFMDDLYQCPEIERIVKIALYIDYKQAGHVFPQIHLKDHLKPVVSGTDWIDINNASVNKGAGIRMIQDKYGINREESMAFGDYMNDLEMLEVCGESYAMANACEEIKKTAAHMTSSNDDDGVMRILNTL